MEPQRICSKSVLLLTTILLWKSSTVLGVTNNKDVRLLSSLNMKDIPVFGVNDTNTTSGIREKRQDGQARTLDIAVGPNASGHVPLSFEREVYGKCRYRTAPEECFKFEWTAYATIANLVYTKITSNPPGILVHPGDHPRVRVYLKLSCCYPTVQFVGLDLFLQANACVVDVRELQDLHPGEIAGIVIGALLFFIIAIAIIAICIRRQRQKKLEKETVIFGRSLTRSKSRSEFINRVTSKT